VRQVFKQGGTKDTTKLLPVRISDAAPTDTHAASATRTAQIAALCNNPDGLVRDVRKLEDPGFPVFARGSSRQTRGARAGYGLRVPVDCGGACVKPGDRVFADYDVVIVVPSQPVGGRLRARRRRSRPNWDCDNGIWH
jgi:regulator of RNase E activity RraA